VLKKCNIGLITVALDSPTKIAEIVHFPTGKDAKNNLKTRRIKKEMAGRTVDTQGGTQQKVNTAYRERNVRIATLLEAHAPLNAPALIKTYGCEADAYTILRNNVYGWYEKIGRGTYALTDIGRAYLQENATQNLVIFYRMKANS